MSPLAFHDHLPVLPILLPLLTGALLVLLHRRSLMLRRSVALIASVLLLGIGGAALIEVGGGSLQVYQLGNWPSWAGIVLVLDRLSALMLTLTAILGLVGLIYAAGGTDQRTPHFHALFQFQLAGLCGAFLTGDLFNLFVFFEVLLIASYGLLLHGGGVERYRRALHYVGFNLLGSLLFLIGVGWLYGLVGTLNMADMAAKIATAPAADLPLIRAAAITLLLVFAIKAALLPLYFWLPGTYAAATAPVAALFAVMTKVGFYASLRVSSLSLGTGAMAGFADSLFLTLGAATLILAALGALSALSLRRLVAYLVVASAGTLFIALGQREADVTAAALYYLVHSSLAAALLFLLAEQIHARRRHAGDALNRPDARLPAALGVGFAIAAIAAGGLPPLSGFLAKAWLLGAIELPDGSGSWTVILIASFLMLISLVRAGSKLYWKHDDTPPAKLNTPIAEPVALLTLIGALLLLVIHAETVYRFTRDAAEQLARPQLYIDATVPKSRVPAPSMPEATP
ncbi:MAG: monovalent cation/H+ antiporter subunit D [Xanthomonadales bacterium]|jgi:multicomponent K+:H+ antiporter subunit D|nr:monovalent cation/H+ antiporter subunit D [Xanthomonadales bacterium]